MPVNAQKRFGERGAIGALSSMWYPSNRGRCEVNKPVESGLPINSTRAVYCVQNCGQHGSRYF